MRSLAILPAFTWLISLKSYSQDTTKTNPIIYAEAGLGAGVAGITGLMANVGLNYQFKKGLITARYVGIEDFSFNAISVGLAAIPGIKNNGSLEETGLLYGLRFINGGRSFSFSIGLSSNNRIVKYTDANNQRQRLDSRYVGFPFEANILWFKSTKKRYRIYGIIPVGKPTGFGGSIGLKLAGNVSRHSYAALGLVIGQGYHRKY